MSPPTADSLAGRDFHFPALRFRVAGVHAENFGGEQRGFVAARAGADFEHDVLLVVGIFGQQQNFQVLLDLHDLRFQTLNLMPGHLAEFGVGFRQHLARLA